MVSVEQREGWKIGGARGALGREEPSAAAPGRGPTLRPDDARWILALRTRQRLQGGTAAVLPAESRAELMQVGRRLGLRAFDAALIIAIVQDDARVGGRSEGGDSMIARLWLVPAPGVAGCDQRAGEHGVASWLCWVGGAVVLALLLGLTMASWLGG